MSVPMIRNAGIDDETAYKDALVKIRNELRKFMMFSRPEVRTPELWARYYDMQANAVWYEDSLLRMQRARQKRDEKLKAKTMHGSLRDTYGGGWSKRGGRKRDEEDE